jgi:hypothetical protein
MWIHEPKASITKMLAVAIVLAVTSGCSALEPYIYDPFEFNRNLATFGQPPTDIDSVDVCYTRQATTAETVRNLASERCAAYGKKAVFQGQDILECPILTPLRARYSCDPL